MTIAPTNIISLYLHNTAISGVQHNARSVAQVALVDEWGRPLFNVYIKQDLPVHSYINELTGLTKEILDEYGLPMAEAMAHLRAHLSPNALLIGQSIQRDVQWLQLAEGVDYHSLADLSTLLRVWNPQRGEHTSFSLDHCAKCWIGVDKRAAPRQAIQEAAISMALFNAYRTVQWEPLRLFQMQQSTLAAERVPGFSALHPVVEGCCMGNRKRCTCGASFDDNA
jgi:DNA polymerase III epsilon subunit-like protein